MRFIEIATGYPKASDLLWKEDFFRYPCIVAKELGLKPEIWCIRTNGLSKEEVVNGVLVRRFSNVFTLFMSLWKRDIALIHAYLRPHLPSLLAGLVPKPKVFTTNSYELGSTKLIKAFSLSMLKNFDMIIAITPYEEKIYKKQGIRPIKLIPFSIDYKFFSKPLSPSKKTYLKYGVQKIFTVVAIANFRSFKNLDVMLKAFEIFNKKVPISQFIVIGQDMLKNNLYKEQGKNKESIRDMLKSSSKVHWLGHRSHEEIREILSLCDVYMSSSSVESQGLTNYEAAASGTALCLSDIGSFTTVFKEHALYHSAKDPKGLAKNLLTYHRDAALRKKKGASVKALMAGWDYSETRKKLKIVYKKVLKKDS